MMEYAFEGERSIVVLESPWLELIIIIVHGGILSC